MPVAGAPSGKGKSIVLGGVTYSDHGTKDGRNVSELELEADDYYFSPTFLRGNPGQKLTLLVKNEATTLHNLSIRALGVDKDIPPKSKVQVDVTVPASGVLAFSCKFHGALGMNGQLRSGDAASSRARWIGSTSIDRRNSPLASDRTHADGGPRASAVRFPGNSRSDS